MLNVLIREIDLGVDFLLPAEDTVQSQVPHALPSSIGMMHGTHHDSTIFYRNTGSAYFEISRGEATVSLRGLGWARSPSEWKTFINDLAPALADAYHVSEHPNQFLRSVTCDCQLGNRNYNLDLERFDQMLRSLSTSVKKGSHDRLLLQVGSANIELTSTGRVKLKGLTNRAQIYSLIQLLDAIRLALEFQDYFQGKNNDEGIYAGVRFRIETHQIPIETISPTQEDVDIRGVKYYRELLKETAHLRVVTCIAHVGNETRYVLLDGHHRARACYEEHLTDVDALILCPSSYVEIKAAADTTNAGVRTIADLKNRQPQTAS